jgi:hypothetical protein
MHLRLETTIDFNVRAKRGERKGPKGCLRQVTVTDFLTFAEARERFDANMAACDESAGHMTMIHCVAYSRADYHAALANWKPNDGPFVPPSPYRQFFPIPF